MTKPYPEFNPKKHIINLALGDKVTFTAHLTRIMDGNFRRWTPSAHNLALENEGYVVGKRTLWNGEMQQVYEYDYDEDGRKSSEYPAGESFWGQDHFTAYLISYNLNRKPVYVLPEHITKFYASTVVTHHFNPDEPNIDTIHTFGSNDGGVTWEIASKTEVERDENAFYDEFPGVSAEEMQGAILDMLVAQAQADGDYE